VTRTFRSAGAAVIVLGDNLGELGGSEYLVRLHGTVAGTPPALDLDRERSLQRLVVDLVRSGLVESAHDCSDGGVAVALAECTFDTGGIGIEAAVDAVAGAGVPAPFAAAAALFGESASRIVVSAREGAVSTVLERAAAADVPAGVVGRTGGADIRIDYAGAPAIRLRVADAEARWAGAIGRYFERAVGAA
jgi:phosphoribosylformylglycinamidine synthase